MDKERGRRPSQLTLEEVSRIAKETILEQGGHVPTVIVEGSIGSVGGRFPSVPKTHEEKVHLMLSAGFAVGQSDRVGELEQVFLITEGWLSLGEEGKPPHMQPSQDPNRKEVLIIDCLSLKENRNRAVIFEMVRDSSGRLTELKEFEKPREDKTREEEGERVESPLLDAFVDGFRLGQTRRVN